MPYIKVNTNKISRYSNDINSVYTRVYKIKSEFASIGYSLDWDIKSASGINNRIKTIENELSAERSGLKRMQSFLNNSATKYNNVENKISAQKKKLKSTSGSKILKKNIDMLNQILKDVGKAVQKKASEVKNKAINVVKNFYDDATKAMSAVAGTIKTAYQKVSGKVQTTISYFTENYQNKGWVYKTIQYGKATVKAAGGVAKVVAGVASIVASAGLSTPAAVLTCLSGLNDLTNAGFDYAAIYNNDYDRVGSFNALKDGLSWVGGKAGKLLGNEEVGSNIGKGLYYASEVYVGIANLSNAWDKVKQLDKTNITKLGQELKDLGNTKIDVWKVLNTDISQLKLNYALAKYEYQNVAKAADNLGVVSTYVGKLANVIKKTNQTYSAATGTENWLGKVFDSYDNATSYKDYTYGGIKSTIESITKNFKIVSCFD